MKIFQQARLLAAFILTAAMVAGSGCGGASGGVPSGVAGALTSARLQTNLLSLNLEQASSDLDVPPEVVTGLAFNGTAPTTRFEIVLKGAGPQRDDVSFGVNFLNATEELDNPEKDVQNDASAKRRRVFLPLTNDRKLVAIDASGRPTSDFPVRTLSPFLRETVNGRIEYRFLDPELAQIDFGSLVGVSNGIDLETSLSVPIASYETENALSLRQGTFDVALRFFSEGAYEPFFTSFLPSACRVEGTSTTIAIRFDQGDLDPAKRFARPVQGTVNVTNIPEKVAALRIRVAELNPDGTSSDVYYERVVSKNTTRPYQIPFVNRLRRYAMQVSAYFDESAIRSPIAIASTDRSQEQSPSPDRTSIVFPELELKSRLKDFKLLGNDGNPPSGILLRTGVDPQPVKRVVTATYMSVGASGIIGGSEEGPFPALPELPDQAIPDSLLVHRSTNADFTAKVKVVKSGAGLDEVASYEPINAVVRTASYAVSVDTNGIKIGEPPFTYRVDLSPVAPGDSITVRLAESDAPPSANYFVASVVESSSNPLRYERAISLGETSIDVADRSVPYKVTVTAYSSSGPNKIQLATSPTVTVSKRGTANVTFPNLTTVTYAPQTLVGQKSGTNHLRGETYRYALDHVIVGIGRDAVAPELVSVSGVPVSAVTDLGAGRLTLNTGIAASTLDTNITLKYKNRRSGTRTFEAPQPIVIAPNQIRFAALSFPGQFAIASSCQVRAFVETDGAPGASTGLSSKTASQTFTTSSNTATYVPVLELYSESTGGQLVARIKGRPFDRTTATSTQIALSFIGADANLVEELRLMAPDALGASVDLGALTLSRGESKALNLQMRRKGESTFNDLHYRWVGLAKAANSELASQGITSENSGQGLFTLNGTSLSVGTGSPSRNDKFGLVKVTYEYGPGLFITKFVKFRIRANLGGGGGGIG
jgi:hypothetical protein